MNKRILISLDQVIGHFAMWAIRQSPYNIPENLETACEKLRYELEPTFIDEFIKVDWINIDTALRDAFKKIPEIEKWNKPKSQHGGNIFVTRHSNINPDDDFIDLGALARNVSMSVRGEEEKYDKLV